MLIYFYSDFDSGHFDIPNYSNLMSSENIVVQKQIANFVNLDMKMFENKNLWDDAIEIDDLFARYIFSLVGRHEQ